MAQTLSNLHSSRTSCPILSLLSLTEPTEITKDLLCWLLPTSYMQERRGQLQNCLIMLTPQQRMHLQTQVFMCLACEGSFFKGNFSGPANSKHLLCAVSDGVIFSLKSQSRTLEVHQYSYLSSFF